MALNLPNDPYFPEEPIEDPPIAMEEEQGEGPEEPEEEEEEPEEVEDEDENLNDPGDFGEDVDPVEEIDVDGDAPPCDEDDDEDEEELDLVHLGLRYMGIPLDPTASSSSAAPPIPSWIPRIQAWSREQHLPVPCVVSREPYHLLSSTVADRSLPTMIGQVAQVGAQSTANANEITGIQRDIQVLAARLQFFRDDQHFAEADVTALEHNLNMLRNQVNAIRDVSNHTVPRVIDVETTLGEVEETAERAMAMVRAIAHHLNFDITDLDS